MEENRQTAEMVTIPPTSPRDRPRVESLVLQLIHLIDNHPNEKTPTHVDDNHSEIILTINIEGVNYTLSRKYVEPSNAQCRLSPREKEIANLIAKGHPNKTIAEVLEISPYTVATHIRRMFHKLDVNSRAEMTAKIVKQDLI